MSEQGETRVLRIATYMCPSQPIELYELVMELLETALDSHTVLIYEGRGPGGPLPGRLDPFQHDQVDIAFMSTSSFLKLSESNSAHAELLPVTPVFAHPNNTNNEPGYFADIIIHRDKTSHNVNSLQDLRGCSFAFSNEDSLSGSQVVLKALNDAGENATFFGNTLKSGSHIRSAQMVLTKQAEWASVDSTTLLYSKKYMQDGGKDIIVLKSIGPLPPYPVVVNSRLPEELKKTITEAFLALPHNGEWKKKFAKYGIVKYSPNSASVYDRKDTKSANGTKRTQFIVPYY